MAFKGLRSLIFEETSSKKESEEKANTTQESTTNFPNVPVTTFPTTPSTEFPNVVNPVSSFPSPSLDCAPHMQNVMEIYQKGFDSLNKEGYDFYEFYKAVMSGGVENPLVYQMALNMGLGIDSTITKEKLLEHSNYYLEEIEKVYNLNVEKGKVKKESILNSKAQEDLNLREEVKVIEEQLSSLNKSLDVKKKALENIEAKYSPELNELECKLLANTTAKNTILDSIHKVINGLKTNIK